MSDSQPSKVFLFDSSDPEMQRAYERARATFRYFWRELAWERRRIIPGLDLASVKVPFSDGDDAPHDPDTPRVEHMWLGEVDFDGQDVTGVLLNEPNWLTSVKSGDPASVPLDLLSDWMYASLGEVYGAHTVNLHRSRMSEEELAEHDSAWGLEFGDPNDIQVARGQRDGEDITEHPMSESMATKLPEWLDADPSALHSKDDAGWTMLHHLALAGSTATVQILLDRGADIHAVTNHGMTALALARSLKWDRVEALLVSRGAK